MQNSPEIESKKEIIAQKFLEYFLKHGMVKTMINDVAKDLHMSKKTIYKYFVGGKQECLYYLFFKIGRNAVESVEPIIKSTDPILKRFETVLQFVFKTAVPYVLGNRAENEEDYLIENLIVGQAFKDAFRNPISRILLEGKNLGDFHFDDLELTFLAIYGMILQSMELIHSQQTNKIQSEVISLILKILH
jgi:AcrR family transcriptional regulator